MRLLLDEMWPGWLAVSLRDRGHDVVSVLERDNLVGRPDADVFASARVEQRAIVTENVIDFRPLARGALDRGESHPGLVCTSNRSWPRHRRETFGRLVDALGELLNAHRDDEALADREVWL